MATNASEEKKVIYLSINQGEQAKHQSAEYLLAAPVFEEIARLLDESLRNLRKARADDDLDDLRAHETILLDGGRGTGKTTILVNLSLYMESVDALRDRLLILKPVDPTLFENDDDLFLNIIVAAILRDKTVKKHLDANNKENTEKITAFYKQLQSLGHALEGTQKQKSEFGIEKLRAFVGNHSVAEEVHKLFAAVLDLTGKEMIVLPIDDVDTSLENAFKNLEVVRRYLASPYIVPIISGDQELFHEVIWRNFYHGLTANCNELKDEAIERAKRLAIEYERKLIPVARKLRTPDLASYFHGRKYRLEDKDEIISFSDYKVWLSLLCNFHINGFEDSRVEIEFSSLRSFCQFVKANRDQLVELDKYLGKYVDNSNRDLHFVFIQSDFKNPDFRDLVRSSIIQISEIMKRKSYGSDLAMIYEANRYWFSDSDSKVGGFSVFDTPLFKPLSEDNQKFLIGEEGSILKSNWKDHLSDRVADFNWLENLPERTVVSFPKPDKGLVLKLKPFEESDLARTVYKLMVQDRIYAKDQNSVLVFFGRIFELLTLSMMPFANAGDLAMVFFRDPYYSVTSFSGTKEISLGDKDDQRLSHRRIIHGVGNVRSNTYKFSISSDIYDLVNSIIKWRNYCTGKINSMPNALLVYRVMNKFFTQLSIAANQFSDPRKSDGLYGSLLTDISVISRIGLKAFNAYCAAMGSFERSETRFVKNENAFLLPDFFEESELFSENVKCFLKKRNDRWVLNDEEIGWTGALYLHPLKSFLEACANLHNQSGAKKSNDT